MMQPSLSLRSRYLSFLPFLLALVLGLVGAAPLINNALYHGNKLFLSWLLIDSQGANQWLYPLFLWGSAAGLLLFGSVRRRRIANSRDVQFNVLETTGMSRTRSSKMRVLLRISGIGAYLVLLGFILLSAFGEQVFNMNGTAYADSLSYQRHVYLLSVAPG